MNTSIVLLAISLVLSCKTRSKISESDSFLDSSAKASTKEEVLSLVSAVNDDLAKHSTSVLRDFCTHLQDNRQQLSRRWREKVSPQRAYLFDARAVS